MLFFFIPNPSISLTKQQIVMGAIDYLIRTASGGELWIIVVVIGRISLSFVHGSKINMWVINWISNCKMASITPPFFQLNGKMRITPLI